MDDRIDGVVLTLVDITSTREREQQLREQAKILDLAHVMMHFGADDRIVQWNQGCERLYGYTASEAIGRNCNELLRTEFPEPLESIKASLEKNGQWEGGLTHTTKTGARVIIASHWILDRSDNGSIILEVNNDITARRRAEEALRTADQNKDRFLSTLAHELRNPLGVTLNTFELLTRSLPAAANRLERGVIERQLKNLTRMVDDLLDIQRLTHGKLVLARRPLVLAEIIESAVEAARRNDAHGHTITVQLPEEPVIVSADSVRLAQVFTNLLENAIKFTPASGSIEVTAEQLNAQAVVTVRDTGIGLRRELLERLFDMYAQAEPSGGFNGKGLGVGLNLVRQIVELHDGQVTAHSAGVNQGSEFIVSLPLTAAGMESPEAPSEAPASLAAGSSPKRVMIVDDNQDSADAIASLLASSGFIVHTSHDGALGLEESKDFKPEVAILDIGLPGMNGFELARRLRAGNPDILLIALSGWRQDSVSSEAQVFDHYFTKPIEISAIESLLLGKK